MKKFNKMRLSGCEKSVLRVVPATEKAQVEMHKSEWKHKQNLSHGKQIVDEINTFLS